MTTIADVMSTALHSYLGVLQINILLTNKCFIAHLWNLSTTTTTIIVTTTTTTTTTDIFPIILTKSSVLLAVFKIIYYYYLSIISTSNIDWLTKDKLCERTSSALCPLHPVKT